MSNIMRDTNTCLLARIHFAETNEMMNFPTCMCSVCNLARGATLELPPPFSSYYSKVLQTALSLEEKKLASEITSPKLLAKLIEGNEVGKVVG